MGSCIKTKTIKDINKKFTLYRKNYKLYKKYYRIL